MRLETYRWLLPLGRGKLDIAIGGVPAPHHNIRKITTAASGPQTSMLEALESCAETSVQTRYLLPSTVVWCAVATANSPGTYSPPNLIQDRCCVLRPARLGFRWKVRAQAHHRPWQHVPDAGEAERCRGLINTPR